MFLIAYSFQCTNIGQAGLVYTDYKKEVSLPEVALSDGCFQLPCCGAGSAGVPV